MTTPARASRLRRTLSACLRRIAFGRVPKLFDAAFYRDAHPDAARSSLDPFLHYVLVGARKGYEPNADFDTPFYRAQVRTRLDPLRHYLRYGAAEGYDPHPGFNTRSYLERYPDVVAAGTNPLQHYRQHGRPERRIAEPSALVARDMVALAGVPSAHRWVRPARDGSAFALTLLRAAPRDRETQAIDRVCLSLTLSFAAIDALILTLDTFQAGVQDAVRLDIPADATRSRRPATLLLVLDHCVVYAPEPDGTRIVGYAEATAWDLRPEMPQVIAGFRDGTMRL